MPRFEEISNDKRRLRAKAEARLADAAVAEDAPVAAARMLHELQVHQIELEMQNQSLRQAQAMLEESRDLYASHYDFSPLAYLTVAQDGRVIEANQVAAALLGVDRGTLVGQAISRFILDADRDTFSCYYDKRILETGESQGCELRMVKLGGKGFWVHLAASAARDADGSAVLRLALSDITERKQAEVDRRENHEILRGILETTLDGYWRTDGQGHLVDVNAAYCKQSGYTREELLRMHISDLEAKETQADTAEHIRHIIANGSDQFESMHRRKDGSVWHVEVSTTFRDITGGEFFVFLRDITERKRVTAELEQHRSSLEQLVASRTHELEQAKAAAEKADNAKSRFLAAASHDLRQPLSALSLFVSVLRNTLPPGSGELVGSIQDCVDSLSELLTDLLDVSKLDAGVVTPKHSDFAVDDMLATLVSIHSAEAELKGLRLRMRRSGIVVHTDQQLLHRILGNLVSNAIRYTDRGGMLIACRRRNGRHWVEVWDSGVGISGDKTGIIFEEFRQLGDDARHRGSGLGLSIVAKTAALLGLRIRLTSRPGRGSMFAVELPAETGSGLQDALPSQPTARALRIGLVEDHARVLEALVLALEGVGHRVIAAATGQALIERLGDQAPDIVISDYRLAAAETGFDVIAAVRATFDRELPAVLITGDTDPALVRSMADRGIAVHYKPLQIEALQAFIGHATERRRRER